MEAVYLDTHAVVWLCAGRRDKFPDSVQEIINSNDVLISPIVILEMQYLIDAGKIKMAPAKIIKILDDEIGLKICEKSFPKIVEKALRQNWTHDPFDRIITAQAALDNSLLVTRDESILTHYSRAAWS